MGDLLNNLLDFLGRLIMPDWKALIDLIPLLLIPLVLLWILWAYGRIWLFGMRHRRQTVPPLELEPPRPAPLLPSGAYDFPLNTPFWKLPSFACPVNVLNRRVELVALKPDWPPSP